LAQHIIKIEFKLNLFDERLFKWFENNKREGFHLEMLPKSWRVNICYYRGRYHMYNSDYHNAREQLRLAFELCHTEYIKNK